MNHEGDERDEFTGEQTTRDSESEGSSREDERESSSSTEDSGGGHVFRIVPADPKNNFDFEDVADK